MADNKASDKFLTISELFYLCRIRWRWFVVSVTVCLLFAVRHLMTTPYLYSRSAAIMVREDAAGNNATDKNSKEFNDIGFLMQKNSLSDIVKHISSLDVLMEVALRRDSTLTIPQAQSVALGIQGRLKVEGGEGKSSSNIINLTYKDFSTGEAARVLALIIEVYNSKWVQDKQEAIRNTSRFIDEKMHILENELNIVDDSISAYKSRFGITEINHVSDVYLQQQSRTDAEILKLINQKSMAEYIRRLLDDEASQNQLLLVNSGINNSLIESQITVYNSLLLQMQSHMEYTSEQNPLIINLEKELSSLRKNILANVVNHIRTIDIQLSSYNDYYGQTMSKIASNPEQAKHLISIEREQKVKESLYMYLLQKKEENEISLTYQSAPSQVIEMPHGGGKPTSPNRIRVLFSAVFLGLLIPFSIIFILAVFDDTVRTRADFENRDDIIFLGEIPYIGKWQNFWQLFLQQIGIGKHPLSRSIVVDYDKQDLPNEAFRVVRTNLERMAEQQAENGTVSRCFSYIVTSSQVDAGKTFVGLNLAITLAIGNKRVLFIDADLREASASRFLRAPKNGLSELLSYNDSDYSHYLYHIKKYPTLDIISAGDLPANPTELLRMPRFSSLLTSAREDYDFIIIDAPTAGVLADSEIISKYTDASLFIIRAGKFERSNLDTLKSTCQFVNSSTQKQQYVILNGVSVESRTGYGFAYMKEKGAERKWINQLKNLITQKPNNSKT